MKTFKTHSKYFIIAALTLSIVWGAFAQVSIPTGLTNAVQYIRDTLWTSNGTNAGTVNVKIDPNYIYVNTGFLNDGTGWNSKALGLDSSGNVVYVDANAINTPFFNLAGNYIPKINQAWDDLELSSMFQSTLGDIGVWHINPLAKMHIQWDFRVDTVSGSLMQYTYTIGTTQVIGAVNPPNNSQLCDCDTTNNALDCSTPSFTTWVIQWVGQWFCVDITASWGWIRNYRVYMQSTTNINQGAFIVTGNRAWVMTLTPQATLDVNGNLKIANIPLNGAPTQVLVIWANGEVQYAPFPSWSAWEINTASNIGWWAWIFSSKIWVNLELRTIVGAWVTQVTPQGNTVQINTPAQTLSLAWNTLSISSGNSVNLPAWSSSNWWNLTGNAWTNPVSNFIGTTDNANLAFRVNWVPIWGILTNWSIWRGIGNWTLSNNATIAWWTNNSIGATADSSAIGWGSSNIITAGQNSTIWWWTQNTINIAWDYATIWWGRSNQIGWNYATIGWWRGNIWSGVSSFIGWWYQNIASWNNSTIAGWDNNKAIGSYWTVWGWTLNTAWAYASVWWWNDNIATGNYATIWWWSNNKAQGIGSSVVWWFGNNYNTIAGYASIAGWSYNEVPGGNSIALGANNRAEGNNSMAIGQNAIASWTNSFVRSYGQWSWASIFNNEFMVNAEKIIIWDIQNADPIFFGQWYNLWQTFSTYLPGSVGIDELWAKSLTVEGTTYTQWAVRRQYRIANTPTALLVTDHIIIAETNTTLTIPACTINEDGREIIINNLWSLFTINIPITGQLPQSILPWTLSKTFLCLGVQSIWILLE